jgi:hypothetical protein
VEVCSHFLTCGIRSWFNNLGSELKSSFSKSHKSGIFKAHVKECRAAQE